MLSLIYGALRLMIKWIQDPLNIGYRRIQLLGVHFPECVARVSVSLWGSGGWRCVRSTLRSRAQPSATVRARTIWPCLWEVLQEGSFLEVSDVSLLRFAWQAWHFVTFSRRVLQRVEKSFCVAGAILLWRFQKMCCSFRGRRSTLDVSIVIFRGRRSTLDVSCCVWLGGFLPIALAGAASSGDKVQIPWQACRIFWHVLKNDGSLARNIDFEVANFQVLRKTRRKTSSLKLQSVKIGGNLARNACFGAPTCLLLESLVF